MEATDVRGRAGGRGKQCLTHSAMNVDVVVAKPLPNPGGTLATRNMGTAQIPLEESYPKDPATGLDDMSGAFEYTMHVSPAWPSAF